VILKLLLYTPICFADLSCNRAFALRNKLVCVTLSRNADLWRVEALQVFYVGLQVDECSMSLADLCLQRFVPKPFSR
jgi:hypothetical protein